MVNYYYIITKKTYGCDYEILRSLAQFEVSFIFRRRPADLKRKDTSGLCVTVIHQS